MEWFKKSVAGGMMIGIGAAVYLSCENRVVGALLFSVGLFCICSFGMGLFTGKIGYVLATRNSPNCAVIWLGNLVGSGVTSLAVRVSNPALAAAAAPLVEKKLALSPIAVVLLSALCGMLMYLAVDHFNRHPHTASGVAGLVLCVATFILCGFEHSIADMNYCFLGVTSLPQAARAAVFLLAVSLANGVGALLIRALTLPAQKDEQPKKEE